MGVDVQLDTSTEVYELGATIDGVWVPFASVPVSDVEGRRNALQAAARDASNAAPAAGGATATATTAPAAATIGGDANAPSNEELQAEVDELRAQIAGLGGAPAAPVAPTPEG